MPIPVSLVAEDRLALLEQLDSALAKVKSLTPLDEERFLETHTLFESLSDQRARIIKHLCARVECRSQTDRPLRVLGVGSGSGDVDLPLAKSLSSSDQAVQYQGLDPNRAECKAFERRFEDASLEGVNFEVAVESFDDFTAPHAFDVIHLVHSMYYMPDPAASLERARGMLAPGGELVVFHAPCEALNDLAVLFYDKAYGRKTLFSEDYARLIQDLGWPFERDRLDARVDVTSFVQGDAEDGSALRDFIVQFSVKDLPEPVRDLIDSYLECIAFERGERSFISHPVECFYVEGPDEAQATPS